MAPSPWKKGDLADGKHIPVAHHLSDKAGGDCFATAVLSAAVASIGIDGAAVAPIASTPSVDALADYTDPESEEMKLEPKCASGDLSSLSALRGARRARRRKKRRGQVPLGIVVSLGCGAGLPHGSMRPVAGAVSAACTARPPGGATMNDALSSSSARPPGSTADALVHHADSECEETTAAR